MFSSGPNYTKLKTNLRLAIARLKLLEKKKTELTEKSRREIADYIRDNKIERAKIRVEYIIREDYLVEAMEIVEMYCDLLLARFGLITNMKELDSGIAEAVASLIWVAPRMQSDCNELKVIADLLGAKYGPNFAEACRVESVETINARLKHKLSIHSPPKLLVEKYVIEIAKSYNVPYEPDPQIMETEKGTEATLIDLSDKNNLGGNGGGGAVIPDFPHPPGFLGYPQPPPLPNIGNDPFVPFNYPAATPPQNFKDPSQPSAPFSYNIPPDDSKESNTDYVDNNLPSYSMIYPDFNKENDVTPPPEEEEEKEDGGGEGELQDVAEDSANDVPPEVEQAGHETPEGDSNITAEVEQPDDENEEEKNIPPKDDHQFDPNLENKDEAPKPLPRSKINNDNVFPQPPPGLPELPSVPTGLPGMPNKDDDDIDFDDLNKRFNELKKKK